MDRSPDVPRPPAGATAASGAQARPAQPGTALLEDIESLADLYDRHSTHVFSLAMRIVREVGAAEDITQDVFLYAWMQRHRYDPARGPVVAWLLILTRSRSIDRLRARRRQGDQPMRSCDCVSLPAPALPDPYGIRRIREALMMLPADQRHPLELAYYEGYTHSEISKMLNQPLGTVKTRIRRAIFMLRTAIASPRLRGSTVPAYPTYRLRQP